MTQHNHWCLHSGCTSARTGVGFRRTFAVWFFVSFELKDTFCKPQLYFTGALVWALICLCMNHIQLDFSVLVSAFVSKKNLSNTHNFLGHPIQPHRGCLSTSPSTAPRETSSTFPHMRLDGVIIRDQVQIPVTTTRHDSIEYWQYGLLSLLTDDKLTGTHHLVIDKFNN